MVYSAEAVVNWGRLALQWASYELGSDSDLAEEMRIVIREPKKHTMWGQRTAMAVGSPVTEMFDLHRGEAVQSDPSRFVR